MKKEYSYDDNFNDWCMITIPNEEQDRDIDILQQITETANEGVLHIICSAAAKKLKLEQMSGG